MTSVDSYVSLGDSFVSGPGIDAMDPGSKDCLRSVHNYPTLLATALNARSFTDVSCAGASTVHLLSGTQLPDGTPVPAQIDAISEDTQLVTVGIGANDSLVLSGLWGRCTASILDPTGAKCEGYVRDQMPGLLKAGNGEVVRVLDTIASKAPQARIVLVGYLRVAPDTDAGACLAAGFRPAQAAQVSRGEELIDKSQAVAAKTADVDYVSLRKTSLGHDACAGPNAWVNTLKPPKGDGVTLHPNAAGMRAVADAIADRLKRNG